jgi:hypothetical protein
MVTHGSEKYYFPGYEVFEYLVSNIALALVLHLFSHSLYEKYFAKKTKLSKLDLEKIKRIVRTELKTQSDQISNIMKEAENLVLLEKIEELLSSQRECKDHFAANFEEN